MKDQRKQMYMVPKLVQSELERIHGAENVISFRRFAKGIAYGTYSMLYGAIKNPNFGTFLEIVLKLSKVPPYMDDTKKSKSKMLMLLESSSDNENCSFKESFNQIRKFQLKDSFFYNLLDKCKNMKNHNEFLNAVYIVKCFVSY